MGNQIAHCSHAVCRRQECKDGGKIWLQGEGLIAAMDGAQRVANPLCTMAVPEPARATVGAKTRGRRQQVEGSEAVAPCKGTNSL